MSGELSTTYDARAIESDVYERWHIAGAFNAEPGGGEEKYCIVIPPPNVTAPLHLGHALNNTLQDVLIRFNRMRQLNTLWMPGTDHAGIATQTVVEKRILAAEGRKRTDFRRDEFVSRIQAWKDEYERRILEQLRLMGCSCDWRRTRFTMDEMCAAAVRTNFYNLFRDGLIYRGKRLVNWDPATQTVLADDEVEHENVHGYFWYLRYPLVEPVELQGERIDHVTVATTRPETMLGDTAVAMNPSDPRASSLVGRQVRLPLVGRVIPIIADGHVVLPDPDSDDEKAKFSTGFLKVTPAHDLDDYAIGQRHDLPLINVMAPDGSISDRHGWDDAAGSDAEQFLGMDRFEARKAIVEWFRGEKLLEDVRDYVHPVGHSYRSHVPIEPYLSDQWYVAVKKPIDRLAGQFGDGLIEGTDVPASSLAGLALKPVLDGRIKFTPDRYAVTYRAWLENLRDWPISRQLWWGHQIPVWSKAASRAIEGDGWDNPLSASGLLGSSTDGLIVRVVRENGQSYIVAGVPDAYEQACRLRDDCNDPNEEVTWYACLLNPDATVQVCALPKGKTLEDILSGGIRDDLDWIGNRPDVDSASLDHKDVAGAAWLEALGFQRDPDVLDTWFSSALWPFSTLGWPRQTPELETFYPGDVLCTAREIITLWVSRMVMMGQYCVGDIPFTDVFIHAMIQDGDGRKMSKSLGNGIDPLDIIDSHGADAMRFTLTAMTTQTQDVRMPVTEMTLPDGRKVNSSEKFDLGRNFCNKLWNASRFVMMNLSSSSPAPPAWDQVRPAANLADAWILSRLNTCVRDATAAIGAFRFNELADVIYHFTWDDFCDWYVEIAKSRINTGDDAPRAVLAHCLDSILRILHPIMPFITEAIWQRLNEVSPIRGPGDRQAEELLVTAQWPQADAASINATAESGFSLLQGVIRQIRDVRRRHNVAPSREVSVVVEATGPAGATVAESVELLKSQARLGEVKVRREPIEPPAGSASVAVEGVRLYILDIVDRDAELARLTKQADSLTRGIRGIEGKLASEGFLKNAPPEVVSRERERLKSLSDDLAAVQTSLNALN